PSARRDGTWRSRRQGRPRELWRFGRAPVRTGAAVPCAATRGPVGAGTASARPVRARRPAVKIAVIVQRYGQAINGGAELHARYIAEHLAPHVDVEVLTTCATDYVTWRNALAAGSEQINGVTVRRFPVKRERDPVVFGRRSDQVFQRR